MRAFLGLDQKKRERELKKILSIQEKELFNTNTLKTNRMTYLKLPKRAFNSPLIEFANFRDGSFVNLIKLIKPYADGTSYAVYETTKNVFCSNGLFKSYNKAKEKFELMIKNGSKESPLIERNTTKNKKNEIKKLSHYNKNSDI